MNLSALLSNRWVFGVGVFVVGVLCGAVLAGCPAPTEATVAVEPAPHVEVSATTEVDATEEEVVVTAPSVEAAPVAPVVDTPTPASH